MKSPWQVVKANSAAAQHAAATRNPNAERGVGRGWRHEANMTPTLAARVTRKAPLWGQSRAVEVKKDLTGKTGALQVNVRSGNTDPAAIGIDKSNWGVKGLGDAPSVTVAPQRNLYLIGGIAALAAIFLMCKGK